ncbi:unnamed protein product [Sphagnum balticum]
MFRFFYSQGSNHGLLASHHQFSQGDMVAISQKSSLDDEDSTVIEGVVIDQARSNVAVDNLLEGLLDQVEAQVMAHPLMKKALPSREAAISQRQETRQINKSKRHISHAK